MTRQTYADVNEAGTGFKETLLDTVLLFEKLVACFMACMSDAKQHGRNVRHEVQLSNSLPPSNTVPSVARLSLIMVRFGMQLRSACQPQAEFQVFPQLSRQPGASPEFDTAMHVCGVDLLGKGMHEDATKMAARWEEHALRSLQGRVLPGCSYWDCTNVSGFSEEALTTRLCSGCRRVCYCCMECQWGAWVEGHREVCASLQRGGRAACG